MAWIRPELRAALWRFRELLAAAGLAALGGSWILTGTGLMPVIGVILGFAGLVLAGLWVQRARFRSQGDGPGVVRVIEGQISYFGPLSGGVVALSELERLALDHTSTPASWVLDQPGRDTLFVPVNAAGAEALMDAFARLPGLRTQKMLAELQRGGAHAVVIWEKTPLRPQTARLH